MGLTTTLLIALSLAMDAFSVCVAAGVEIRNPTFRHYFRLSYHFGLFQFLMPVLGYHGGVIIENIISRYDHWIAFALLCFIGVKMIVESFKKDDDNGAGACRDPSRGMTLVMLSVATSIDAAAVGFSFAALNAPIFLPAIIIGVVCAGCSAIGLYLGNKIGGRVGAWAERFGGGILITIGVKIVVEHLM